MFTGPEGNPGSHSLMKYALSLTEGELTAGRWNCPNHSWWGVGAGERRRIMKLTGDLSVSSIYRSHFISTCNIKWETDWNTGEMTACHLEQPAELSPRNGTVHLYSKSDEEGSWGKAEEQAWIQRMVRYCQGNKLFLTFHLSPPNERFTQRMSSEWNHWFLPQTAKNHAGYFTWDTDY